MKECFWIILTLGGFKNTQIDNNEKNMLIGLFEKKSRYFNQHLAYQFDSGIIDKKMQIVVWIPPNFINYKNSDDGATEINFW